MSVFKLSKKQLVAAGHTLWQAAAGSGAIAVVLANAGTTGIHASDLEQGAAVAGIAVAAAALSLVKGVTVNAVDSYKGKSSANADRVAEAEKIAAWVIAEYNAKHVAEAAPLAP